jgi:hypothetical protein
MKHQFFYLSILLCFVLGRGAIAQIPNEFYYVNTLKSTSGSEVVKVIQDEFTGDFVVAGTYRGSVNLDPNSASITHSGTGNLVSYIAKYDMFGDYLWSISLDGTNGSDTVCIKSIDVGADGYIYAVGYYTNALKTSYPATTLPHLNRTASQAEGFVARINPFDNIGPGQFILPLGNGTTGVRTYVNDCKYVLANSLYPVLILGGKFMGTSLDLNLDDSNTSPVSSTGPTTYSGFITAISATANHTTGSTFSPLVVSGSMSGYHASIDKLCMPKFVGNSDTLNFAGTYNGTTSTSPALTSIGDTDILLGVSLMNFGITGPEGISELDYKSIGSAGQDGVNTMIVNEGATKIFLSGYFNGTIDVDPSANSQNLGPSNNTDAFIGIYNRGFQINNAGYFSGSGIEKITSIALWNPSGDTLLLGGYFTGENITNGPSTVLLTNSAGTSGSADGYMMLVGSTFLSTIRIGGSDNDFVHDVAVSLFGEAIAAGGFSGTVDFDNSTAVFEETATSGTNGFISFYGQDLNSFVDTYNTGHDDDEIIDISIDEKGDIFAIGTYTGSITIGSSTLNSAGGTDVFIQRKNKDGVNQWAFNAGRLASGGYNITDICAKINSTANDAGRGVITSDTSVYIAYTRNDTAYTQRINKNTGSPVWTQKINKNGSNIGGITADAQYLYIVGDSAGIQITQRINKNTGGPVWTQRSPGGKGKAITEDNNNVYTVKDSSGHAVVSRINKNTGGPVWTQRTANNSGTSITTFGDDLYMMSDSAGTITLKKINKNTGGPVWTQKVGTGTLGNVAINAGKGNLYITGTFTGSSSYLGLTSSGGTDGFVARINKNTGGPVWTQRVGGLGADSIKTLQVTAGGDIYIGGNTQGGTFGTTTAGAGVFLVRLSVDSLDRVNSILPVNIQPDAFDCQIYPNPTRDMFNISAVLPKMEFVQIRLIDLRGKVVHQEAYNNQNNLQTMVDIGELPNSVYILQVQAGKQQVIRKIIKQ